MLFPEFQKRRRRLSTRVGYAKAALALSGGVANESIYLYADRFIVKPLVGMGKHLVVTGNEETVWKSLLAAEWHLFTCAINDGIADFEAERLAKRFARDLREEVGAENYEEIRRRNATPEYRDSTFSVCASHDFCDANMVMGPIIESAGIQFTSAEELDALPADSGEREALSEKKGAYCALWSRVWDIALERHLRVKARPSSFMAFPTN